MIWILLGSFVLFSLPFVPSLIEVWRRTDVGRLKITDQILHDPRQDPILVFWQLAKIFGFQDLDSLKQRVLESAPGSMLESTQLGVVEPWVSPKKESTKVLSAKHIQIPSHAVCLQKLYSYESIHTEGLNTLSEAHALQMLRLGKGSRLGWWASGSEVVIEDECELPGKVIAGTRLKVGLGVRFHFLEAPQIGSMDWDFSKVGPEGSSRPLSQRLVYDRSEVLKPDTRHESAIVFRKKGRVARGCQIFGSIKAHGELWIESGVVVHGNVVGSANIHIGENVRIFGSVLANQNLILGSGCHIGTKNEFEMVSARQVDLQGSFCFHGRLRAWRVGQTASASS